MAEALAEAQRALGQRPREDMKPLAARDALAALDASSIERGAVLSTAYMYAMPELSFEDEQAKVQAENDYVAFEAAAHPERLAGFCSVNPRRDYALEELRRCAGLPGIVGYKLHFANSDLDLRDAADVERLRHVFRLAQELDMALAVHMRTRHPEYGAEDATVFVRELLPLAPDVPVQIAHMGGWGVYDDATDAALGVFADAIQAGEVVHDQLVFDIAAVVAPISRVATADPAMVAQIRSGQDRMAERIRQIGPERVVYGTDWDAVPVPGSVAAVQLVMPLTLPELATILGNRAAYFR